MADVGVWSRGDGGGCGCYRAGSEIEKRGGGGAGEEAAGYGQACYRDAERGVGGEVFDIWQVLTRYLDLLLCFANPLPSFCPLNFPQMSQPPFLFANE